MKTGGRGTIAALIIIGVPYGLYPAQKKKQPKPTPLEAYVESARQRARAQHGASPGSLWMPDSRITDLASDPRASQVDDLVTIVVAEKASAVSSGATKTARASSAKASVTAAGGVTRAAGPLVNLLGATSDTQLDGSGTTSRETVLTTTISARVVAVLPNGYLVLEGTKNVGINSERQLVVVRGVARPIDLGPDNTVPSDRLAELEVQLNGRGVVGDAVRRPFFLYRLLLGLLPL